MFKPGHVYTHRNLLDTKIYVKSVTDIGIYIHRSPPDEGVLLQVTWFTKSGTAIAPDEFEVKKEHFEDWRELC